METSQIKTPPSNPWAPSHPWGPSHQWGDPWGLWDPLHPWALSPVGPWSWAWGIGVRRAGVIMGCSKCPVVKCE